MRRRGFLRAVGSLGSAAAGVAVGGVASTGRVEGHPGPYDPYGSIDVAGAKEAVVDPDAGVAYLATTTGYAAVDVSVPDRPELVTDVREPLADREGGPLRGIFDVKLDTTDPTTLAVAGPANPRRGAIAGLLVVDVTDPADPVEAAFHPTEFPIHNCFVRDGLAYLTANDGARNPIVILDVTTGETVGRWSVLDENEAWAAVPGGLRSVHDVFVAGDRAFVALWDAGTWILDVSDPASPMLQGKVDVPAPEPLAALDDAAARRRATLPPGNHHYVATDGSGTLLGVGRESWGFRADEPTATPRADVAANDTAPDGTASRTAGADADYVGGPSGIDLWDVSDPEEPAPLATVPAPASPDPSYGGVWTTAHNFELAGDVLYSSWYRGGVKRHDVADPTAPQQESWWRDPESASFWTARLAAPGEREGFFVASSMAVGDTSAGLYTFPDHAGQQAEPPSVLPSGTATPRPRDGTPTGTATETPAAAVGGDVSAPGFGAVAGIGAIGVAAWRLLCRAQE
jgi:hypothetical protein